MARGQRKTIEEKIAEKEELLKALQTRMKSEKEELEAMYKEKREKDMVRLSEVIATSGLTPDEAAEILRGHLEDSKESAVLSA